MNFIVSFQQENDVIRLLNKVDDNWFEGMLNGQTGYIPQSYVNIKIPL
jgi:endophilin-A